MVRIKSNKRWAHKMKLVTYYEFIAVIKDVRVRVIVRREDGGEPHFWRMDIIFEKRLLHNGNPSED